MTHWIYTAENKIFTYVSYKGTNALSSKYPKIYFTQTEEPDEPTTIFPTVYVNFKGGAEKAKAIEGNAISAYTCNIEVKVTCNSTQKQDGARRIAYEILGLFTELGFSAVGTVHTAKTGNDTHEAIFNVSRLIGSLDKIG